MYIPTPAEIQRLLDRGSDASKIDDLFYPGESTRTQNRKAGYPRPEGTGRCQWPQMRIEQTYFRDGRKLGVWSIMKVYANETHIGTIESVRKGFLDTCYRTHDGEEFAHWGGPQGAETYLVKRYWLYGDPEKPFSLTGFLRSLRGQQRTTA